MVDMFSAADMRALDQMQEEERLERLAEEFGELIDAALKPYLRSGLSIDDCLSVMHQCCASADQAEQDREGRP